MSVFIVAEMSGNHRGSINAALDLIGAAWESGADAVKLQTMDPDRLAVPGVVVPTGPWRGRGLRELYREAMTPWDWHPKLFEEGRKLGIEVFSSPFDPQAVAFLSSLNCPRFKIASAEVGDYLLLKAIAATQKPFLISDGMSDALGIDRALAVLGRERATLLRCVSEYPAKPIEYRFGDMRQGPTAIPSWGISDHSMTPTAAIVATAMGATVLEKHLCLGRSLGGPDAGFSLEPAEFRATVQVVREAEAMRGAQWPSRERKPSTHAWLAKSLWVVRAVQAGEQISEDNVQAMRPGNGMHPFAWPEVCGRRFTQDVPAWTPLGDGMVAR